MNDDASPRLAVVWRWEVRDENRRSGWRELAWCMTEDHAGVWARANATEVRRVEGSREERRDVAGPGHIPPGTPLRFYTDLKRKPD